MGLSSIEQDVLQKWKSIRRLYAFLERELGRINRDCFKGRLPLPSVQLLRMKYSWDVMGEGYVGAFYQPGEGDKPAQIGVYPLVLLNTQDARTALAHEMVHHWEWYQHHHPARMVRPPPVHFAEFPSPEKQYYWRLAHSFQFMAKAGEVAHTLGISLTDFLFKKLK